MKLIKKTHHIVISHIIPCDSNMPEVCCPFICGVRQGSVLGPRKYCLYLLPLCSILKHHNIGYHIHADNPDNPTELHISFKCNDPLATLPKLNSCISGIRVWMIKNKLKINDSKTEFIVFRSPQAKQEFSGLSISVGDSIILKSS